MNAPELDPKPRDGSLGSENTEEELGQAAHPHPRKYLAYPDGSEQTKAGQMSFYVVPAPGPSCLARTRVSLVSTSLPMLALNQACPQPLVPHVSKVWPPVPLSVG